MDSVFRTRSGCWTQRICAALPLLLVLFAVAAVVPTVAEELPDGEWKSALATDGRVVVTPEGVDRLLFPRQASDWQPKVARFRGGTDLYAKVAPAVVVVRVSDGHGTGFLISPDGWILTNHHVVSTGLAHDAAKQASYAMVHVGRLGSDGAMTVGDAPSRAYVYKLDRLLDLALLRLHPVPAGRPFLLDRLLDLALLRRHPVPAGRPFLPLAARGPRPGMSASMVGHPSSGMLWTFRTGQVAATGRAPTDLVDVVMARLVAVPSRKADVAEAIRQLPSRRVVLSSIGANPGDSGGPLVNGDGEVIAVTFGIPGDPSEAKFTYHVHLDEVKSFLMKRPSRPSLVLPDPWDAGPLAYFRDFDGDNRIETLMLGEEETEIILIDVSGRTPLAGIEDEDEAYEKLVAKKGWRFDFAARIAGGESTVFYDSDSDGTIDLILAGSDPEKAETRMTWRGSAWKVGAAQGPTFSYDHLKGSARQKRLQTILQAMESAE